MEIFTAFIVMLASLVIQHLGLADAIMKTASKIASCGQCFVFWSTFAALLYDGCDIVLTVVLAALMSYLSNWFILLLVLLQRKFTKLYEEKERNTRPGNK